VLVIGDLHEPFCLDEYLDFCKQQYDKYGCNQVIFIGDIIDNHYSSYHETDPDGLSGGDELEHAIRRISRWYKTFPKATVIIGNHDRMVMRKGQTANIPKKWIKSYKEVLEVSKWQFVDHLIQDNVLYQHGEGGTARTACKNHMMNIVQGHYHTQCYTEHYVGKNFRTFSVQTGCGINFSEYSFAYAKFGKKPAIACAVVLENGTLPINLLMPL
tara:strand:+ start:1636 stop:2277 length:642 start_codon:yes stop_codon:yes gene_type:complete